MCAYTCTPSGPTPGVTQEDHSPSLLEMLLLIVSQSLDGGACRVSAVYSVWSSLIATVKAQDGSIKAEQHAEQQLPGDERPGDPLAEAVPITACNALSAAYQVSGK